MPRDKSEVRNLTWREFDWLMSGIDIEQPKAIKTSYGYYGVAKSPGIINDRNAYAGEPSAVSYLHERGFSVMGFHDWPQYKKVVRFFLESGKAPEQGFKSCVSLKKYAERYKAERIEEACCQILMFSGDPSIRGIYALLKSPVKKAGNTIPDMPKINHHRSRGFTRGAEQFREGGDEK